MLDKWETATMSHITSSVTASVDDLTRQMTPYLGDVGARITDAVTKKTIKGVVDRAKVASPSRETEMVGANIAQGFIVGAEGYIDDARAVGSKLGSGMVQTASGLFVPGGATSGGTKPTTPGVNLNDIAAKARFNRDALLATQAQKQTAAMNQRMNTLNKAFMSGTFALSALSGVASMAGGNLGKFSQILFQITGPLFALSSIIQLLTGEKVLNNLKKIGLLRFGAAAIAIGAFIVATKLINNAREKERMAIEGVGRAANLTSKQIEKLGGVLGFTPVKSNLEFAKPQVSGLSPQKSQQVEEVRKMLKDDKDFKDQINGLKAATKDQADIIFKSIAVRLAGQGATTEAIQNYVYALQQEAGRLDVSFDFKSIDLKTAAGQAGLKDAANKLVNDVNFAFAKGYKTDKIRSQVTGEIVEIGYASDELKQKLFSASQVFSSFFMGIETQLATGKINADQFTQSFNQISNSIREMPKAQGMMVLSEMLKSMPSEIAKAAASIKNMDTQFRVLEATMLGVYVTESMLNTLISKSTDGGNQRAKNRVDNYLIRKIAEAKLAKEALAKIFADPAGTGGQTKTELKGLAAKIKALKDQTEAFTTLIGKQIDFKTAIELTNDAEIVKQILDINAIGNIKERNKAMNEFIKLTKTFVKVNQENQDTVADPRDKEIARLDNLQKFVALNEKLIDLRAAPQIKAFNDELEKQEGLLQSVNDQIEKITKDQIDPIQKVIEANNYVLQQIALQEDAINEKYNKQVEALDKIEKANQNIANIQKQRMSIADALTRGDISAAAQAMQEARAERAQSALTGQRDTLTRVRDERIAALGRVGIEKTNKILQLEIATIERGKLLTYKEQKTQIEAKIEATNRELKVLNTKVEKEKESANYFGKTRLEIETSKTLLELSKGPLDTYAKTIAASATSAKELADALERALKAALAMPNTTGTQPTIINPGKYDQIQKDLTKEFKSMGIDAGAAAGLAASSARLQAQADAYFRANPNIDPFTGAQKRMFGGPILSKGRGGMGAVKSMAFGGRAIGSDSVPAMLTPGEFVMNKAASKAYGPLLERINESKYPGMLSGGGMTQIPVTNISTSMNDNSTAVYNYNLGFSINGANGSAKDIANAVMREIKNVDSQRIRGQRR